MKKKQNKKQTIVEEKNNSVEEINITEEDIEEAEALGAALEESFGNDFGFESFF